MRILYIFLILLAYSIQHAQVAVSEDGSLPHSSAMLHIQSMEKGILIPRMMSSQRTSISSPAQGLLVYDVTTKSFWFFDGTIWQSITGSNNNDEISDVDNDTRIEVEQMPDEDEIHFTLEGDEKWVMADDRLQKLDGTNLLIGNTPKNAGGSNVALGQQSFAANTSGSNNTVVGFATMYDNTTGGFNAAFGISALAANTSGQFNTAIGPYSMSGSTGEHTGDKNTAVGFESLYGNSTGYGNVAIGASSMKENETGYRNTALGFESLQSNISGYWNSAVGYGALRSNTYGFLNTATGKDALADNVSGSFNTAIGNNAMKSNTHGSRNVAIGYQALFFDTTGNANVAVGDKALYQNRDESGLVAVGDSALYANNGGGRNTAVGTRCLSANISGNDNTALGYQAGMDNEFGDHSVFIGFRSGEKVLTSHNTFIGSSTAIAATGESNTVIGSAAGTNLGSGSSNTIIGTTAGHFALGSAGDNVFVGGLAGQWTSGSENTFIGTQAGSGSSTTGSGNVFIGYQAGMSEAGDDKLHVTNSDDSTPLIWGDFALDSIQINGHLTVRDGGPMGSTVTIGNETLRDGGVGLLRVASNFTPDGDNVFKLGGAANRWIEVWSVNGTIQTSDRRQKTMIRDMENGLSKIMQLRPVTYQWKDGDGAMKSGLIAQEVQEVIPEAVYRDVESDLLGINYADLIPLLIEAIQELRTENTQLRDLIFEMSK